MRWVVRHTAVGDVRGAVLADASSSPPPEARPVGLVFQDGALFSSLTVLQNVASPLVEHTGLPLDMMVIERDTFAAGHVAGTWGDVSQRKGTHDYYNEAGIEVFTW